MPVVFPLSPTNPYLAQIEHIPSDCLAILRLFRLILLWYWCAPLPSRHSHCWYPYTSSSLVHVSDSSSSLRVSHSTTRRANGAVHVSRRRKSLASEKMSNSSDFKIFRPCKSVHHVVKGRWYGCCSHRNCVNLAEMEVIYQYLTYLIERKRYMCF